MSDEYREIPIKDIKREFHAQGIRPSMRQLMDFASHFETESMFLDDDDIEPALWYAVRQVSKNLSKGMNFNKALDKVQWPAERSGKDRIHINRAKKVFRKAPDSKRELNLIHARLRELIEDFMEEQEETMKEYKGTLNPFKRRRISKSMLSLDEFLYGEAKEILEEEFHGSPHIEDMLYQYSSEYADEVSRRINSSVRGKWDPKKFRRWVSESLFELEERGRNKDSWEKEAIEILNNNYPSRRDDDDRLYKRAVALWRDLEAHGSQPLADLAVDLRNQFGVGR